MSTFDAVCLGIAAWIATYLVHSTLLFGAAALATRRLRAPRLRELAWKAALLGGLATATLHGTVGGLPWSVDASRWLGAEAIPAARVDPEPAGEHAPLALDRLALEADRVDPVAAAGAAPEVRAARSPAPRLALRIAVPLQLAWAAAALARLVLRRRARAAALEPRRRIGRGPLRARMDALARAAGPRRRVRLESTPRIASPIAVGLSTICVPPYAERELDPRAQDALLAHELAHLRRLDAAWATLAAALAGALPLQPLLRVCERRLRAEAELCCDADAVRATGDAEALARCLLEVARRSSGALEPAGALAMTAGPLVGRVEAVLAGAAPAPRRAVAATCLAAAAAIGALAGGGPGVRAQGAAPSGSGETAQVGPGASAQADEAFGLLRLAPPPAGPTLTVRLDGTGALYAADGTRLAEAAAGLAAARPHLAALARAMPRADDPVAGTRLPDGVLRVEAGADTPFRRVLGVLAQCGAPGVSIRRTEIALVRPDGRARTIPYTLPADAGPAGAAPRRCEVAIERDGVWIRGTDAGAPPPGGGFAREGGWRLGYRFGSSPVEGFLPVIAVLLDRLPGDATYAVEVRSDVRAEAALGVLDHLIDSGVTRVLLVGSR